MVCGHHLITSNFIPISNLIRVKLSHQQIFACASFPHMDNLPVSTVLPQSQASIVELPTPLLWQQGLASLFFFRLLLASLTMFVHSQHFPYISCAYQYYRLFFLSSSFSVVSTLFPDTEEVCIVFLFLFSSSYSLLHYSLTLRNSLVIFSRSYRASGNQKLKFLLC